jgi:2-dehydropantoate 2-reductase
VARIRIAGAGALGSVFGGLLSLAGHGVTLLGRRAHLEQIRQAGLRIEGIWGEHRAVGFDLATEATALRGRFDAILFTVKSYHTGEVARAVAPRLAPDGVCISLQNGLGNAEAIAAAVAPRHLLAGRVIFGAEVTTPGSVRITVYAEPVLVGTWPPVADPVRTERARTWVGHFARAGIPAELSTDIDAALWGKVFYNAALNPLGALLGLHYGALGEDANARAIMDTVIREAFAVARAEGVALSWATAAEYGALFYSRLLPSTFHHRSSMLQDLERGARTEIDALCGAVVREGRRLGVATPVNADLFRRVREREGRPLTKEDSA